MKENDAVLKRVVQVAPQECLFVCVCMWLCGLTGLLKAL